MSYLITSDDILVSSTFYDESIMNYEFNSYFNWKQNIE